MIHGKGSGLEIVFAGKAFGEAFEELQGRLVGGPDFYRGTRATVIFDHCSNPVPSQLDALRALLGEAGMAWEGAYGEPELEPILAPLGVPFLGGAPHPTVAPMPSREAPHREVVLSDHARSLVADFAGARTDLVQRRDRIARFRNEPIAPRSAPTPARAIQAGSASPAPAAATPAVLYHRGTLRGGQALANLGHIVVVGDVNPGAELVAGGDIVVFGQLRGVAHAGAQGDRAARVYALLLAPTQLRIATTIAAGDERSGEAGPEEAFISAEGGDRIAIVPAGSPSLPRASSEHAR